MTIRSAVIADDEFLNRDLMEEILSRLDITVRTAKDGVVALRLLEEEPADLLMTDIRMPGMGGLKLLHKAKEKWPAMPVVMMTAYASVESAVESMRQGAYDYLMKPFGVEQVEALLLRLQERQQLLREVVMLREDNRDRHRARNFLGATPVMNDVFAMIERAARSNATVLVNGESGTGKELVARALHEQSQRASGPFVKVNCAALTETLLASELFGHEKGSFTGADTQRIGRFELADKGTILLDEISEISPELQAKLLRVLEERQFERVGGEQTIAVDVRVIATTNRDLPEEVAGGRFREDLYYRLNVIPIAMPPLRERGEDVPQILNHYLQHFGAEMGCQPSFTKDGLALLCAYPWPGNVRELVNVVERLVVLSGDVPLDERAVRRCLPELARTPAAPAAESPAADSDDSDDGSAPLLSLDEAEKAHLQQALKRSHGDLQAAADLLQISPRVLQTRMKKHGL